MEILVPTTGRLETWVTQATQAALRLGEEALPFAWTRASRRIAAVEEGLAKVGGKTLMEHVRDVPFMDRLLDEYKTTLRIPEHELTTPGRLILDLGAGLQGLARNIGNLKSTVVSVEPRVALPLKDPVVQDYFRLLQLPEFDPKNIEQHARLRRWALSLLHPHPQTIAAFSHQLPFREGTFDNAYAMWSVPYYLRFNHEVVPTFEELLRVMKPGGKARIFPIETHYETVQRWKESVPHLQPTYRSHLLTFTKPE